MVGQGLDKKVGVLLFDFLGNLIDEMDDGARLRAFAIHDGLTLWALAGAVTIVLGDADHAGLGLFLDPLQSLSDQLRTHFSDWLDRAVAPSV